jgi:putative redox protein
MSGILKTNIRLLNDKLRFSSAAPGKYEIITDYLPPFGNGDGYYPMELFLVALGTCAGGTILSLVRKFGRKIESYEIRMTGEEKEEHPKSFSVIHMDIYVQSPDAGMDDFEKANIMTEKKYCPVWAMIRGNVEVVTAFHLNE